MGVDALVETGELSEEISVTTSTKQMMRIETDAR